MQIGFELTRYRENIDADADIPVISEVVGLSINGFRMECKWSYIGE